MRIRDQYRVNRRCLLHPHFRAHVQLNVCSLGWSIESNTLRSVASGCLSFAEPTNRWTGTGEPVPVNPLTGTGITGRAHGPVTCLTPHVPYKQLSVTSPDVSLIYDNCIHLSVIYTIPHALLSPVSRESVPDIHTSWGPLHIKILLMYTSPQAILSGEILSSVMLSLFQDDRWDVLLSIISLRSDTHRLIPFVSPHSPGCRKKWWHRVRLTWVEHKAVSGWFNKIADSIDGIRVHQVCQTIHFSSLSLEAFTQRNVYFQLD